MTTAQADPVVAVFARERVHDIWDESQALFAAHWREIAHYQDIDLAPDAAAYFAAQDAGTLRCYTARVDGRLVGYAFYFVRTNIHYSGSRQATQDVLYVDRVFRCSRIGKGLIVFADDQLRAEGIQVVYQHVKLAHDFGPLLERLGYEPIERIYARRLDRG